MLRYFRSGNSCHKRSEEEKINRYNEITKERWTDWIKEETQCRMMESKKICIGIITVFILFQGNNFFNWVVTHLRASIIKIDIIFQLIVIFQMRGVIQFTDVNWVRILWIFFEVKTDTVVVQIAQKLTIIKVLDFSCFGSMVYQSSFSKEVIVRKHHCALSL